MDRVRFGVVGLGNIGGFHARYIDSLENATLTAICDAMPAQVEKVGKGLNVAKFSDYEAMLASGLIDAVLIATPHFQHGAISRAAFARNIHVLTEKPVSVTVKDARQTNDAHAKVPHLKYGIVYQSRIVAMHQKMRDLVAGGELGELSRVTWITTDWFRTWSYFASSSWRATWAGEGGGVLLNQCPHNLDTMQWVTGLMPKRITAVGFIGKTHPIEVEDEISAILEYENGCIGQFMASTGEAPGTNRLEIVGDRGKLVSEYGKLLFTRTRQSVRHVRETSTEAFARVESWDIDIPYATGKPEGHQVITQNFVNAILRDEPLLAPGVEAVKGLEMGNAMLMAALMRTPVELPLDGDAYDAFLKDVTAKFGGRKTLKERAGVTADIVGSFVHR